MSITAELRQRNQENVDFVAGAVYREEDKAVRKCPKCGSVYFAKTGIDHSNGIFPDCNVVSYCTACMTAFDTEEVNIE